MRIDSVGIVLLCSATLVVPAAAQTTPSPPTITRTVIAATKLPNVVAVPLYFRAVSVTLQSAESSSFSGANGIVYQISGSTEVSVGGGVKMVIAGEGLFIPGGEQASLKAGSGEPSTFLHFLLTPAMELDQPTEAAPAIVHEIYRLAAPIPALKAGSYDLNLTRVTFLAQMPSNAPHHRSGAALYYILSGTGANTIEGKTESRGPGSLIYEPFGLVHQWGNPGDAPLTFLAFNINPDGVPAVVPGAPETPR
jgi:quercetin dioxygenase-like cupin family protein